MPWSKLLAIHHNRTLPEVMFKDPDWFFFLYFNKKFYRDLLDEVEDVYLKACHIRIPGNEGGDLVAEYVFSRGEFIELRIVPRERPVEATGTQTIRKNAIDMSVLYSQRGYDKRGYRVFMRDMKEILFGNASARMSKERCEKFFNNSQNFDL